jgi:hypothetical protein
MVLNNVVEAYALYEGVCIVKYRNVSKIMVFGDILMVVARSQRKISLKTMSSMVLFPALSLSLSLKVSWISKLYMSKEN